MEIFAYFFFNQLFINSMGIFKEKGKVSQELVFMHKLFLLYLVWARS